MSKNYSANVSTEPSRRAATIPARFRHSFKELRTEGTGAGREAAAIGLGVFLGCQPFYGFHLIMCLAVGALFRLNRLKLYLAANVSNPLVAPWLLFAELQLGAYLRRGTFQSLSVDAVRATGVGALGGELLLGSVVIGAGLGALAAGATYTTRRSRPDDAPFMEIVRRASDRYVNDSITAWEFARGKLRGDPLYRAVIDDGLLPSGGTLVDIGCGQGLMLAVLAEAAASADPARSSTPVFARMVGVEIRPRIAALAREALNGDATIIESDARQLEPSAARVVLLFDVLHLMSRDEQEQLLAAIARAIEPAGVVLIREADASAGWRFRAVRVGNQIKAWTAGVRRQRFHFRSRAAWMECFSRHGFDAEVRPMGEGTPFGNVLFRLTPKSGFVSSSPPA
jgi:uncharacterized protein (DUF2062 family)/SAM-dependent methyltransferase